MTNPIEQEVVSISLLYNLLKPRSHYSRRRLIEYVTSAIDEEETKPIGVSEE